MTHLALAITMVGAMASAGPAHLRVVPHRASAHQAPPQRAPVHRMPARPQPVRRAPARSAPARAPAPEPAHAPAPAPAPPPPSASGNVQDTVRAAFAPYGPAAVAWGLRVARCESGFNPRAVNGAGPYYGLFQFAMPTFRATPYGGQNVYDPAVNASAAAWKYAHGGARAWGCN
jgi:soluble lytic murein transglycosylase-like protein